ncbi:MAG: undecaprenyl-diphosphate phosphatase, partial [Actinobacteria bacterium]|nr:undecaprenyl-diphosphate phosphatase [Actinomycetota bacterium]NDE67588.1 undecaprenyl-diphosphate phosphatase [Actinomycetota bacterium]
MEWWQALILGVVQGLTEFFPISSSGHLELVPWIFGWGDLGGEAVGTAFDASLHLGTLAAVVFATRRQLWLLVREGVRYPLAARGARTNNVTGRLAWLYVLTAVPAAVVGALFDDVIGNQLGGPVIVAFSLFVFGAVLWWADRRAGQRTARDLGVRDAWLIGAAQVLALNPGTSRSGITISAMRALGFARTEAVQMSFVLGVPIIAGAGVWKTVGLIADGLPDGLGQAMVIGIAAAALTGWLAINALQRLAARTNFNA